MKLDREVCPDCHGTGRELHHEFGHFAPPAWRLCWVCDGDGWLFTRDTWVELLDDLEQAA